MVPIPIGSNVAISAKEKQIKRPKKDSVLVKHKKWLSDLQKTKERLEEQYIDDLRKKEEEKLKVSLSPGCNDSTSLPIYCSSKPMKRRCASSLVQSFTPQTPRQTVRVSDLRQTHSHRLRLHKPRLLRRCGDQHGHCQRNRRL